MTAPAQTLTFVRSALPEDPKAHFKYEGTLWRDADTGDTIWLLPRDVLAAGLVEKLREGLEHEREHGITVASEAELREQAGDVQWVGVNQATPEAAPPPAQAAKLVGGHTDEWRWDFVQTDEGVFVAVTNRPAVDKALAEHRACPQLHQAVFPLEIVQSIVRMATPS